MNTLFIGDSLDLNPDTLTSIQKWIKDTMEELTIEINCDDSVNYRRDTKINELTVELIVSKKRHGYDPEYKVDVLFFDDRDDYTIEQENYVEDKFLPYLNAFAEEYSYTSAFQRYVQDEVYERERSAQAWEDMKDSMPYGYSI